MKIESAMHITFGQSKQTREGNNLLKIKPWNVEFLQTFIYKDNSTLKLYKRYILYCLNSANIFFNSELKVLAIYINVQNLRLLFSIFPQSGILHKTKSISSEKNTVGLCKLNLERYFYCPFTDTVKCIFYTEISWLFINLTRHDPF